MELKRAACLLLAIGLGWCGMGCGRGDAGADTSGSASGDAAGPVRIVSLTLGETDENREMEPAALDARRAAVAAMAGREKPDVLVLRGLRSEEELTALQSSLAAEGNEYPHRAFLPDEVRLCSQGILSRLPLTVRETTGRPAFVIGAESSPMLRGILDVELGGRAAGLRVLSVHLKSKSFHPLGQTEFRRSEARALAHVLKDLLAPAGDLPLVVLGNLNDTPSSGSLRRIFGEGMEGLLADLRPVDALGAAWTRTDADDTCQRLDYVLVSPGAAPLVDASATGILHDPGVLGATHNRPIALAIRAPLPAQ